MSSAGEGQTDYNDLTLSRQLKQMSKSGTTIRYEYNHEGLRTQKFVDTNNKTDATYYTYNGKNIIHVIKNSDHLHIFYDAQNRPAKVSHNGIFYTYLYNLQGDVIGLLDKNGALVVEYKYDAWGKPLSITGTLANTLGKLNPFRYRGYVYDEETGLYYLRSRYYSYTQNRLINADVALFSPTALIHNNLYTYCLNNPIVKKDMNGREAISAFISAASFLFLEWLGTCITKAYQRTHALSFPAASSIPTCIAQAHTSPSTKDSDRILDSSATNINYRDALEHGTYYIACAAGDRLYIDDTPLGFLDALVAVGVTSITNGIAENLIQLNTKYAPDFNSRVCF